MRSALYFSLAIVGCGNQSEAPQEPAAPRVSSEAPLPAARVAATATTPKESAPEISCSKVSYAMKIDLPEASGATYLPGDTPSVLVVGDSGTQGEYVRLDASTGDLIATGKLPLDSKSSDDLEGLSSANGIIYAITSSGWVRQWRQRGEGPTSQFELTEESYSIAENDKSLPRCASAHETNCAQNYEGLCLLIEGPGEGKCAGFAAAKSTGTLHCLVSDRDGRLSVDASESIKVAGPESLTGCHFDEQGRLWFGLNTFGANQIGYVENWQHPAQAKRIRVGIVGVGFPEAIAAGPKGEIFRFSDTAGSPSLLAKYICR